MVNSDKAQLALITSKMALAKMQYEYQVITPPPPPPTPDFICLCVHLSNQAMLKVQAINDAAREKLLVEVSSANNTVALTGASLLEFGTATAVRTKQMTDPSDVGAGRALF